MTYRELIYICLDEIKLISNDSIITEDHVRFLANLYRYFLLYLKKLKEGITSLATSNELTICVDLDVTSSLPGVNVCDSTYLKSSLVIPDLMDSSEVKVTSKDIFGTNISYVSRERFKYVGYNKWLRRIIYCCLGNDHHLYLKSDSPFFKYLKKVELTGIFEDSDAANELSCNEDSSDDSSCDPLDKTFPIDKDLVPQLIELVVKELSGAAWRQSDSANNSRDDLANLMLYLRLNTKTPLLKLIAGE